MEEFSALFEKFRQTYHHKPSAIKISNLMMKRIEKEFDGLPDKLKYPKAAQAAVELYGIKIIESAEVPDNEIWLVLPWKPQ